MKTKTIDEFIAEIKHHYPPFTKINSNINDLKITEFNKNECFFIWDLRLGEILYANGLETLLGFKDDEIKLQGYADLFHPDEKEYVLRVGQASIYYSIKNPESNNELFLYVSHRIRKKHGDYIKILAQSTPYSIDDKGLISSFLVRLNDISFTDSSEVVQYKFSANDLDEQLFHNLVFETNKSPFTKREFDIIKKIRKGYTNRQIAKNLQISIHTVSSHRKNIMKKSDCHSAEELLLFCKKNGILN
jgi:DNA-binding NarL/FixJ family response regulator